MHFVCREMSPRIRLLLTQMALGVVVLSRPSLAGSSSSSSSAAETAHSDDGLVVEVVEKPSQCTRTTQQGNRLSVHYTGYLANGTVFDNRLIDRPIFGSFYSLHCPCYIDTT